MFARHGFYDFQTRFQRQHLADEYCDIYDGSLYLAWLQNNFLSNPDNISFSW